MIDGKRVLGVIPARGGSKGILRKNVRNLGGKPLIAWTIEATRSSRYLDRVIVSTDDREIAEVSVAHGAEVPFLRPAELASDTATSPQVLAHALGECPGFDLAVLLQPTSPLRETADIDVCIELCVRNAATSAVSVKTVDVHPAHMFIETN
ncbi:MAG: acylneuraminate cytidylyltransferase family protein, partial [Bdellovibrionota bacterium]